MRYRPQFANTWAHGEGATMTTRTDTDFSTFREWADDAYESGLLNKADEAYGYGSLAALQRSIRETGGLIPATVDLLGAGFHERYDDVRVALSQCDRPDLAALVELSIRTVDELLGRGGDPSPRQERMHREVDQRWVAEGGDRFIDDVGRRLMERSGWEPGQG
jgi:hypothetical protein